MKILRRLTIKNLLLNKRRTIVSIIGILLATALLTAVFTITHSMRYSLIDREQRIRGNFHVKYYNVSAEDYQKLCQNRLIEEAFIQDVLGYAVLPYCENEYKPYAYIVAAKAGSFKNFGYVLIEGRFPENENEIVISRHVNNNGKAGIKVGDILELEVGTRTTEYGTYSLDYGMGQFAPFDPDNPEHITEGQHKTYTVVGVMERPSYNAEPYSAPGYTFVTAAEDIEKNDVIDKVYVKYTPKGLTDWCAVTAEFLGADEYLFRLFNDNSVIADFDMSTWTRYDADVENYKYNYEQNSYLIRYERVWPVDSTFAQIFFLAGVVGLIIVGTSIYCIKNSFSISVSEKVRLYGMLAGIGSTGRQIRKSVFREAAIEGAIGIPAGLGLGIGVSYLLVQISNYYLSYIYEDGIAKFAISWVPIGLSVLLGIITVLLASMGAAFKAGEIAPIEAIRNSQEISVNGKRLKTPRYVSKIWGIGGIISYKNIKRNKRKYRTTVVSIVVCTIVFIVTSYFMSLLFSVSRASYAEDDCNVYVNAYTDVDSDFDSIRGMFSSLPKIKNLTVSKETFVTFYNLDYTKATLEYFAEWGIIDENGDNAYQNNGDTLAVIILDDTSYAKYAKEAGVQNKEGTAILYNYNIVVKDSIKYLNLSKGTLSAFNVVESDILYDENGDFLEEIPVETRYAEIEIAGSTAKQPFGYVNQVWPTVYMSETTYNLIGLEDTLKNRIYETNIFFETGAADKLQEEAEIILEDSSNLFGENTNVHNRDASAAEEKSFYTLVAIFAYGLIIVIALIGITNIVNTLSTGMELRARDFATLRSIGMTRNQFRKMVLLESLFTSAKALLIGVTVGVGITILFWRYIVTYDTIILYNPPVKAVLICIAVVFGLVYLIISTSLRKINKRNIIETIKNENI